MYLPQALSVALYFLQNGLASRVLFFMVLHNQEAIQGDLDLLIAATSSDVNYQFCVTGRSGKGKEKEQHFSNWKNNGGLLFIGSQLFASLMKKGKTPLLSTPKKKLLLVVDECHTYTIPSNASSKMLEQIPADYILNMSGKGGIKKDIWPFNFHVK